MRYLRVGICALVTFAVVAHGGVEDWSRAVIEVGAGLLFLGWAVEIYLNKNEQLNIPVILPPLAALVLVVIGQLIFHGTVSPYLTRVELQLLVAYVLVIFVAGQAFQTLQDWRGFVWFVMILGFVTAVFAILQHLTFNGKLYWFRELRYGGVPFGPYVNRNHFAGFAELVLPVALVPLMLGKVRRERRGLVGLFAVMILGALFLAASRGGIISFVVQMGILALLVIVQRSWRKQMVAGGLVVLFSFALVSWLGVNEILNRFAALQSLEVAVGKRTSMRSDTWHIFVDHPVVGTGLGTLQSVFPGYETVYDGKIVDHAHNDYMEGLAETGIAGGICFAWFLGILFLEPLRHLRNRDNSFAAALQLSGLLACCGILVHSTVDFNLHIPANAMLFGLMAYLATTEIPSGMEQEIARQGRQGNRNH
ncbi:MAG TPA: O-antigen ligase family protein [Candidatus Dormibacteraeota bacterium]|nr:O-antigen ligase family protein [Candidatus Dormibacteraeota bacterium]